MELTLFVLHHFHMMKLQNRYGLIIVDVILVITIGPLAKEKPILLTMLNI